MKTTNTGFFTGVAVLSAVTSIFGFSTSRASEEKPVVHATNYPLAYFAERIAGDRIDLHFLPGETDGDPAFWKPSDEDLLALQQADHILMNGATYEKWKSAVSLPYDVPVDTSKAFSGDFLASDEVITHSHGPEGEHTHAGTAFTTWMDMNQAIWQAEEVCDALVELLPEEEITLRGNFASLAREMSELHEKFREIGTALDGMPLVASHPVYQYFARRYDLEIEAVHWEPETVPDDAAMKELEKLLAEHPAKWMIWEGVPVPESVEKLDAIGVRSIVVAPCGNRPESGDWIAVMQANVDNLRRLIP